MALALPDFERPPVIEVALGVQFDPIFGLNSAAIVRYWADKLRDDLPDVQEVPPLGPIVEWFGAGSPIEFSLQLMPANRPNRWFFLDRKGSRLVQLQQDRFVCNWKKTGIDDEYPRYEALRSRFQAEFERFQAFVRESNLGEIVPNQCEVTYVNHIDQSVAPSHGEPERFLAPWCAKHSDSFLKTPESVESTFHYTISRGDQPVGRLHIATQPVVYVHDARPVFLMTLTARGRPAGQKVKDVLDFLDLGRDYVVRGFASVTTREAHKAWGRIDNGNR